VVSGFTDERFALLQL